MDSGGPDSKVFRSYDEGKTWEDISQYNGLPSFPWGIVGIAISPVNSKRIWMMIEASNGGLYRSDNGGNNWKKEDLKIQIKCLLILRILIFM